MASSNSRYELLVLGGLSLLIFTAVGLGIGFWIAYRAGSAILHPVEERPTLRLTINYDGAAADEIERTVIVPLQREFPAVGYYEAVESISQDGKATIIAYLSRDTDVEMAQVIAINLVVSDLHILPAGAKQTDFALTKAPAVPALWLFVSSPDGSRDELALSQAVHTKLLPELNVVFARGRPTLGNDRRLRLRLQPRRLVARNLTAIAVDKVLPKLGDGFCDDAPQAEALREVVLGMDEEGRPVRVRDVGEIVRSEPESAEFASWQGQSAVTLAFEANDAAALLAKVEESLPALRAKLPAGTSLQVLPGPTVPGSRGLILEGRLPPDASAQRVRTFLLKLSIELRQLADARAPSLIPAVVTLPAAEPASFRLYAALCPANERAATDVEVEARVREVLAAHQDVAGRVLAPEILSRPPQRRAPIVLILKGENIEQATRLADTIVERLTTCADVADVWPEYSRFHKRTSILVNFDRAMWLSGGGKGVLTFLSLLDPTHEHSEEIKNLRLQEAEERPVPMGALFQAHEVSYPAFTRYLNGERCLLITAHPAAGVALKQARSRCLELAEQVIQEANVGAGFTVECTGSE